MMEINMTMKEMWRNGMQEELKAATNPFCSFQIPHMGFGTHKWKVAEEKYLLMKIIVIFGIFGACGHRELYSYCALMMTLKKILYKL
ncbi:hypothetical protein R5R35_001359 [Gryllus longicercus]|uniref:Uncharacterized protein n=1 Tax=Gryllus longicercus TaxID=2509291 RepID=A0AAN9VCU3_9ORTH